MCMGYLPACMFVHHGHAGECKAQKRSLGPLEFQAIVSYHVGAGNQTLLLCKSCKCS